MILVWFDEESQLGSGELLFLLRCSSTESVDGGTERHCFEEKRNDSNL